ncbi:hypothetical protein HALLA_06845 [Halostagnicola larsenii XH-48]|uniref:Uncharacterized protein n=1 Tax=Halostagnicola larsenii XH-48 TaxID=797299 RepID=W0JIP9_9EURY|nr:hypothetical protein [Halostagnicola larsenii]AHF98610.1 hypothetical protein HALLA_06845 [Halostagnicola larsenii XH-48]
MSLDRSEAERRRFARLLGIDGGAGSGLPIGSRTKNEMQGSDTAVSNAERNAEEV